MPEITDTMATPQVVRASQRIHPAMLGRTLVSNETSAGDDGSEDDGPSPPPTPFLDKKNNDDDALLLDRREAQIRNLDPLLVRCLLVDLRGLTGTELPSLAAAKLSPRAFRLAKLHRRNAASEVRNFLRDELRVLRNARAASKRRRRARARVDEVFRLVDVLRKASSNSGSNNSDDEDEVEVEDEGNSRGQDPDRGDFEVERAITGCPNNGAHHHPGSSRETAAPNHNHSHNPPNFWRRVSTIESDDEDNARSGTEDSSAFSGGTNSEDSEEEEDSGKHSKEGKQSLEDTTASGTYYLEDPASGDNDSDNASDDDSDYCPEESLSRTTVKGTGSHGGGNGRRGVVDSERRWKAMYQQLIRHQKKHRHTNHGSLPRQVGSGTSQHNHHRRLEAWMSRQRAFYRAGSLSHERIAYLESIGFSWHTEKEEAPPPHRASPSPSPPMPPLADSVSSSSDHQPPSSSNNNNSSWGQWMARYRQLVDYRVKHGTTRVGLSSSSCPDGLGAWVQTQRQHCREEDRVDLLNDIGFDW